MGRSPDFHNSSSRRGTATRADERRTPTASSVLGSGSALPRVSAHQRNRSREGILVQPFENPMARVDASQRLAALLHQETQARQTAEQAAVLQAETFALPGVVYAAELRRNNPERERTGRNTLLVLLLLFTFGVGGGVGLLGQRLGWWSDLMGLLAFDGASTTETGDPSDGIDPRGGLGKGRGRGARSQHGKSTAVPAFRLSDPSRRDDVIAGVRAGSTLLSYCFRRARVHGELDDGTHTVYLDWMIQPKGSVVSARIVAPKALLGTAFAQCVGETIEDLWHFSPGATGVSVSGFPLGPIDVN